MLPTLVPSGRLTSFSVEGRESKAFPEWLK